jgi:hypothetical protein
MGARRARPVQARNRERASGPLPVLDFLNVKPRRRLIGSIHDGREFREDRADAGRNTGHDGAGSNGNETRHEGVFDQVLTAVVIPNSIEDTCHVVSLSLQPLRCILKLPSLLVLTNEQYSLEAGAKCTDGGKSMRSGPAERARLQDVHE